MKQTVVALVVGASLGVVGMSEAGQSAVARAFGALPSHATEEAYQISVGATAAGNPGPEVRHEEVRSSVVVPEHYGEVVAVTQAHGAAIAWYRSGDGVLRNVILSEPEAFLYRLEPRPTRALEVRLLR